jgi:hypothetical protein
VLEWVLVQIIGFIRIKISVQTDQGILGYINA